MHNISVCSLNVGLAPVYVVTHISRKNSIEVVV